MKYTIIGICVFVILMIGVALTMQPMSIGYTNTSETKCVGKTCTHFLLSQMGNKTYNITLKDKPENCGNVDWADCEDHFEYVEVDTTW